MRLISILLVISLFPPFAAFAADDPVARGMKLYEKRHYEEAITLLRGALPSAPASRHGMVNTALGMAYLKNAELHREFFHAASLLYPDYLKRLAKAKGSRFANLYAGEALLASGKAAEAKGYLESFLAAASAEKFKHIATIELGLCYYQQDEKEKAKELWEGITSSDPDVVSTLAAAYAKAGVAGKNPAEMCDKALQTGRKGGRIPMRLLKNCLTVYARGKRPEKGLALLSQADLKGYSYEEAIGKNKVIYFYDLSILDDLSRHYGDFAIDCLLKGAADPKLKEMAQYHLIVANLEFGSVEEASRFAAAAGAGQLPPQLKERVNVHKAAIRYRQGQKQEAVAEWTALAQKKGSDPDYLAEIIFSAISCKADVPQLIQKITPFAERGEGRRFYNLNFAIGKYYFGHKDFAHALAYMEAGRDKGNKNKIEANDAVLLVNLAEVYFRSKKFSEAQEIYFEMGKQFPVVRQIQEALQGIYAREQKSAGDVRIF